jgi:TolB protein
MSTMRRFLLGVALLLAAAGRVQGVLEIEITQGVEGALPVAIVPFVWQRAGTQAPQDIAGIVEADLRRSGLFAPLSQADFPQRPRSAQEVNFPTWRNAGVEALAIGSLEQKGPDSYVVRFQLFDSIRGRQLMGYSIPVTQRNLRKVAHKISDLIFEKLTGERGAFSSRIAYISTRAGPDGGKRYVLQVADSDGYNAQAVFSSPAPLMSPVWAPDGQRIAYVSFENGHSEVFVQNLESGARVKVSGKKGINSAPAWSPHGRQLALVLSVDGSPEIYVTDVASGRTSRVTNSPGINTEPVWTPDGRSLIFTSDRSGTPQLYRVSARGGRARRLTFEGKYNAAADVSPDGKLVAMVHSRGAGFRIAVLELATGAIRELTDGRLDESPSFAPNGSMIIYATEYRGRGVLSAVSADGQVRQRLSLQSGDVREPVWSPFVD